MSFRSQIVSGSRENACRSEVMDHSMEKLPVAIVPISALAISGTPRNSGENREHIRRLAESEDRLPPILVHQPTMRVLDGVHRVRAAELRGERDIEARLFSGDEASSFVLAVQTNTTHGLPLSLGDRKAAAQRIIQFYPQWSDRAIASVTGLAHRTVAAIRACPTGQVVQLDARVGRDGRVRPRDAGQRRALAASIIGDNPGAPLREIAQRAGLSPETVRKIRAELAVGPGVPPAGDEAARPLAGPWQALRADPAFRSTEAGRSLLRALSSYQLPQASGERLAEQVPPHCLGRVAEAARLCSQAWRDFAWYIDNKITDKPVK